MVPVPAARLSWIVVASILTAASAVGQDVVPADTVALVDTTALADSIAPADTVEAVPVLREDPRLTWLGDTLWSRLDSLGFTEPIEILPDTLVDPYTLSRPGARPTFEISGEALLGRGAFSLLDILESESLLLGQDLGGGGAPTFFSWSPGDPGGVQVVVDGVPSGNPLTALWDLRQIPLEGIARIEFYPGPQAAAWGGTGTAGVLSITTRRAITRGARSLLSFTVGSFDVETFSGNFGRGLGKGGSVFIGANFDATEGFQNAGNFTRNQTVLKAGWRFWGKHQLEVTRRGDEVSGEVARDNLSGEEDGDAKIWHLFYRGGVGPLGFRAHGWTETQRIDQGFSYREETGLFGEGKRKGWKADVDARVGDLAIWGSAAGEEQELESDHPAFLAFEGVSLLDPPDDFEGTALENPRTRSEWGGGVGYGDPEGRWGAHATARREEFGDLHESGTAWQAELLGRPGASLEIRAHAGRSLRPADPVGEAILARRFDEALEVHPGLIADPRALAEWTGWRGSLTWSDPRWRVTAAAFGGTGHNAFAWLPPTAWLYFNPDDFDLFPLGGAGFNAFDVLDLSASGAEAELVMPLPYGVKGRLAYRRLSLTEDRIDEQLPYVPQDQALGQLRFARRYFPSRDLLVEARLTGRYLGERTALDGEALQSYLVVDALGQATVINFTIFVSFKNLGGLIYRSDESFDLPETEGYIGVVWRFRG
ncbi:MAG TPA: TonB-dependent receptor plug domain-containing protein [Gemmatimonadota bacterium]|nr:TonB-dependent receptor plug domain-containing protein [Gemmatimonadota bacterium]